MRKSLFVFFIPFLLAFAVPALSQEYTSRREVLQEETLRQGFLIQGEYLAKADKTNVGLHLIADGGKTFRAAAYVGGLPGAGWMPGKPRLIGTAEINGEKLKFNITESRDFEKEFASLPLSAAAKVVMERPQINPNGETRQRGTFRGTPIKIEVPDLLQCPALVFEKQNRQSPSLGSKAPEESLVIFDGTNLDQFQ